MNFRCTELWEIHIYFRETSYQGTVIFQTRENQFLEEVKGILQIKEMDWRKLRVFDNKDEERLECLGHKFWESWVNLMFQTWEPLSTQMKIKSASWKACYWMEETKGSRSPYGPLCVPCSSLWNLIHWFSFPLDLHQSHHYWFVRVGLVYRKLAGLTSCSDGTHLRGNSDPWRPASADVTAALHFGHRLWQLVRTAPICQSCVAVSWANIWKEKEPHRSLRSDLG